ncbi:MAG: extradiol ring-cleavage dioxygenase [Gemmatimonas sp.]
MGAVLGLGLSHFGGFFFPDAEMGARITDAMERGRLPAHLRDPSGWPAGMREEWGNDRGTAFAARHRAAYFRGLKEVRTALDSFRPDAVIIFGDDQYECFREDLVPAYCVFVMKEFVAKPYARARGIGGGSLNIWNDPPDTAFRYRGAEDVARRLVYGLLGRGFDPAYAYKVPHQDHLGHAFTNTLLYLDHERRGFDVPIVPFAINAYGSALIREKGGLAGASAGPAASDDPPGPNPRRLFDMGAAIAEILAESPWRVALVASSSFSHGFLTAKNHFLYPDVETDRVRFAELKRGDYTAWRDLPLSTLEASGQHELLNWYPVIGAMDRLGQKPRYAELFESWTMNSDKCVCVIPPAA